MKNFIFLSISEKKEPIKKALDNTCQAKYHADVLSNMFEDGFVFFEENNPFEINISKIPGMIL